jgi:hypothetical protein
MRKESVPVSISFEMQITRLLNAGKFAMGKTPADLASIHVQLAASFTSGQVYGSSGGSGQP